MGILKRLVTTIQYNFNDALKYLDLPPILEGIICTSLYGMPLKITWLKFQSEYYIEVMQWFLLSAYVVLAALFCFGTKNGGKAICNPVYCSLLPFGTLLYR